MKLRTRITWICCLSVLFAMISINLLVWRAQRDNLMQEAQTQAVKNSYMFFSEFNDAVNLYNEQYQEITDEQLRYYFKSKDSDYIICVRYKESDSTYHKNESEYFVFNHTLFTIEELQNIDFNIPMQEFDIAKLNYEGGHYIISRMDRFYNMILYHIVDINYVWEKMNRLTFFMVSVTIIVLSGMSLIIYLVLRHTLKSLNGLNATAEEFANGNYDTRVTIYGQDEIAKLGEAFNQMAEAVETRTKTLEASERQKTLFMANLTHELKTPLAAISGYAQTLLTVNLDASDREEALLFIDEESKRISRLSKKMMRLLELDSKEALERRDIFARDLFDKIKTLCKGMLDAKNLSLECHCEEEKFYVDEDLMLEVLVNLTENAVKASNPGQTIILFAREGCIEVCDFGRGIPEEEQEKILEPFYMIDKSRSRKNGGAGLGLALTTLILKRHDVKLRIESEVGKGTRMVLDF